MGITIVQKGDLSVRKKNPKIALVLAGGAVTGGAFKLGGLKALDDVLVNRKTTEFDTYVGLSAGAVLAAPLAWGISPAEMLRSLEGKSDNFSQLGFLDFYRLNMRELLERPLRFVFDLLSYAPGVALDVLGHSPAVLSELQKHLTAFARTRDPNELVDFLRVVGEYVAKRRGFPFPLDYLPSGLFDNASLENYLRRNLDRNRMSNDFRTLYEHTRKELYISAM